MFLSVVAGQGGIKVPGAPGTLSLSAGSDPFDEINLSWSAPSDTGGGTISGYRIKMDGSVIVADTSSTGTTYTKTGLAVGTSYNFNVAAINEKGTGADGNTPSLSTKANMSISTTGSPTETVYAGYKSFKFTGSGGFEITANPGSDTFDVIVVGGGGGTQGSPAGAPYYPEGVGGAGGGGVRVHTGQTGTVQNYAIGIGAGGTSTVGGTTDFDLTANQVKGGAKGWYGTQNADTDGGGGNGGSGRWWSALAILSTSNGGNGGSYGGDGGNGAAAHSATETAVGGGGGGAGGDGTSATGNGSATPYAGVGGAGVANTYFDGTTDYWGGGGGGGVAWFGGVLPTGGTGGSGGGGDGIIWYRPGGSNTTARVSAAGTANTGGGGGGAGTNSGGVAGGSGVVIVRIPWGT